MKLHLTKAIVEGLKPSVDGSRTEYFDDKLPGFGVRVATTRKTYFVIGHVNHKLVRVTICNADLMSTDVARQRARELLMTMSQGINPNDERRNRAKEELKKKEQCQTLQELLDEYIQKGNLKATTARAYQNNLRLYLADWLSMPAADITRDMVLARHKKIAAGLFRGKPRLAAANSCFRTLRAILNYAFDDDDGGYHNPVAVLSSRKRRAWFKVERRTTYIKNSDLSSWFKAVNSLSPVIRDYLLFLLFTGLRRNEAAMLKWVQVDFEEECFTIPETKNGQPHTLPMSSFLKDLLIRRHKECGTSPYVFPGTGKAGHLNDPKKGIARVREITGIKFSCHDLRRTFATIAESLDMSSYTIKALLNHKQQAGDVTGGYIILSVDRLRGPMKKVTDAILERINRRFGQVNYLSARI